MVSFARRDIKAHSTQQAFVERMARFAQLPVGIMRVWVRRIIECHLAAAIVLSMAEAAWSFGNPSNARVALLR